MVECKNHAHEAECVASLADRCVSLRREFGYPDPDARSVALSNVQLRACLPTQMILNLLDKWSVGGDPQSREQIARLFRLEDFTTGSIKRNGDRLQYSSKISLLVIAQFQIESCLKNLAREVQLPEANKGLYVLVKALLDRLNLSGDLDVFYTPARIRNSLHGPQGVYDNQGYQDPPILTIAGLKYEFRHGVNVDCAYMAHIAHALEASVEVLGRIFRSPEILALNYVYEQYASQKMSLGKNGEETT